MFYFVCFGLLQPPGFDPRLTSIAGGKPWVVFITIFITQNLILNWLLGTSVLYQINSYSVTDCLYCKFAVFIYVYL